MHSVGLVIGEDFEKQLEAFSGDLEMEPYAVFLTPEEVKEMADHYKRDVNDIESLSRQLEEWIGNNIFLEDGKVCRWTTENPDGDDLQMEPYTVFLIPEEIKNMADYYKRDINDIESLCRQLEEWIGNNIFLEDGKIGRCTTENPNSKFDWYEVGGRWKGYLQLKSGIHVDQARLRELDQDHLVAASPAFIVKDGKWIEGEMQLFEALQGQANEAWLKKYKEIINNLPLESIITVVDIHS